MKKWILLLTALLLTAALLAGCGGTEAPAGPEEPSPTESPAPEPSPTPSPTPEPTPDPFLSFPDGSLHARDEESLDLSLLTHEDASAVAALLREMPALKTVDLGADNARTAQEAEEGGEADPDAPERLEWADIRLLMDAAPQAEFTYRFRFYGKDFSLQDEAMDLNHRTMDDEGAAVREILPCMKHCVYLDMDFCGVSNEAMAAIRDDFPQIDVVWRIWFGRDDKLSVRTDVERILASDGGMHIEENYSGLQYCTKVRYLDMGHMPLMEDWSFLGCMPDLEVAILAVGGWNDLSCLANCTHLEYLEMCSRTTRDPLDLSFLANLKELKHLNICCDYDVTGYEALEELTQLERLWIGAFTNIPQDYLEHLQQALPNTVINLDSLSGVGEKWRYRDMSAGTYDPRYILLCEQFDYAHYDQVCSRRENDPLYKPHD